MKAMRLILVLFVASALLLSACSNKSHPKKCNGKRGTRVPMGVL